MKLNTITKRGYCFYAAVVLLFILLVIAYKTTVGHIYSGKSILKNYIYTSYGGIYTNESAHFIQKNVNTCGHSALSFFLSSIGIEKTEEDMISEVGTDQMLSLADLQDVFHNYHFKTQLLHIDKEYFRKNPQTSILHLTDKHYIVFLWEENGEPKIFDPSYGIVYLSWKTLLNLFSGYMLFVYK